MKHSKLIILLLLLVSACNKKKLPLTTGDTDKMEVKDLKGQSVAQGDFLFDVNGDSEKDLSFTFSSCLICPGTLNTISLKCLNEKVAIECLTKPDTIFSSTIEVTVTNPSTGIQTKELRKIEGCERHSSADAVKTVNKDVKHIFYRSEGEVLKFGDVFVSGTFIYYQQPDWDFTRDASGHSTPLNVFLVGDCNSRPAVSPFFIGFRFTDKGRVRLGWIKIENDKIMEVAIQKKPFGAK